MAETEIISRSDLKAKALKAYEVSLEKNRENQDLQYKNCFEARRKDLLKFLKSIGLDIDEAEIIFIKHGIAAAWEFDDLRIRTENNHTTYHSTYFNLERRCPGCGEYVYLNPNIHYLKDIGERLQVDIKNICPTCNPKPQPEEKPQRIMTDAEACLVDAFFEFILSCQEV